MFLKFIWFIKVLVVYLKKLVVLYIERGVENNVITVNKMIFYSIIKEASRVRRNEKLIIHKTKKFIKVEDPEEYKYRKN